MIWDWFGETSLGIFHLIGLSLFVNFHQEHAKCYITYRWDDTANNHIRGIFELFAMWLTPADLRSVIFDNNFNFLAFYKSRGFDRWFITAMFIFCPKGGNENVTISWFENYLKPLESCAQLRVFVSCNLLLNQLDKGI